MKIITSISIVNCIHMCINSRCDDCNLEQEISELLKLTILLCMVHEFIQILIRLILKYPNKYGSTHGYRLRNYRLKNNY